MCALAAFGPLALGGVPAWTVVGAAVLAMAALGAAMLDARSGGEPLAVPAPGPVFLLATAVAALQLLPMPPALLALASPRADDLFRFTLGPLGQYPAWRPVSLDPPGTALAAARLAAALAGFLAAAHVASDRRARRRVALALGLTGASVALLGLFHALFNVDALFGMLRFEQAAPPLVTPIANPNHLASVLSLGALVTLGLALRATDRSRMAAFFVAYVAQAAAVFLSLSRGGIVAFGAAHVVFAALVVGRRRPEAGLVPRPAGALWVPIAAATGFAAAAYVAWGRIAEAMGTADTLDKLKESKLALVPSFFPMLRDFFLSGVGRGAFESAYPRYQPVAADVTFTHPENWVFQSLCELGVVAGAIVVVGVIVAFVRLAGATNGSASRAGALAGAFAVGLHELVDFGTEYPGVLLPTAIAVGVAASNGRRGASSARRRRWIPALAFALGVAAVPLGAWGGARSLERDGGRLAEAQADAGRSEVIAAEIAPRHPADFYVHLAPALALARGAPLDPKRVLPWANRAMYLSPAATWPHRLAARCLLRLGRPAQARVEYRLAYPAADKSDLLVEIVRQFPRPEDLLDAVPEDPAAAALLFDVLASQQKVDVAYAVARLHLGGRSDDAAMWWRLAYAARATARVAEALEAAARALSLAPGDAAAALEKANALAALGRFDEASATLEGGLVQNPSNLSLAFAAARYLIRAQKTERARDYTARALRLASDDAVRAEALSVEGEAYDAEGKVGRAIDSYRSAIRVAPASVEPRWRLAAALEREGRYAEALEQVEALAPIEPPATRTRVEAARERLVARVQDAARLRRESAVQDLSPPVPGPPNPPGPPSLKGRGEQGSD